MLFCDECCKVVDIPLGVKGAFIASTYTKERFLKKYVKVKPEAMLYQKNINKKSIFIKKNSKEKRSDRIKGKIVKKKAKKNIPVQYVVKLGTIVDILVR